MEKDGKESQISDKGVKSVRYETRIRRASNLPLILALVIELFIIFEIYPEYGVYFKTLFTILFTAFLMHQYYASLFTWDNVLREASDKREFEYRMFARLPIPKNQIQYGIHPVLQIHGERLFDSLQDLVNKAYEGDSTKIKNSLDDAVSLLEGIKEDRSHY